jgi:hypothetical protein
MLPPKWPRKQKKGRLKRRAAFLIRSSSTRKLAEAAAPGAAPLGARPRFKCARFALRGLPASSRLG